MNASSSNERSLVRFILWLFGISVPLWVLGSVFEVELMPGFYLYQLSLGMPAVTALILIYRENGKDGVVSLLKRTYDIRKFRPKIWYVPVLLIYPSFGLIDYLVLHFTGTSIPAPQFSGVALLGYSVVFLMTYGEELGLTGYVTDPLLQRFGALKSGLILGSIWAAYHIPGFLISGFYSIQWIFWHVLYTIAGRVLFVWVYNNSGKSMFSMALFHGTFGIFWTLFPQTGNLQKAPPYYDPLICAIAAILYVAVVTLLWGPETLAQFKFAKSDRHRDGRPGTDGLKQTRSMRG